MRKIQMVLLLCLLGALLCACGGEPADEVQSGIYFYDEAGSPLSGWHESESGRYYLDADGQAATGIAQIDGYYYCFGSDGVMATGWIEVDGARYYLRSNGTMVTGWFSLEGQRYYLSPEGAATGIQEIDGVKYLFDSTGKLTSGWVKLEEGTAWGDENCHPITGWQELDGKRYHFGDDGLLSTGWVSLKGFDYYFHADGTPAQGKITIDGEKHSFASNGQEIVLVNPWNFIPDDYTVELTDINEMHQIASVAYEDYLLMMADCEAAGMQPVVCSAYRTMEYQEGLYRRRIQRYLDDGYSAEEATKLAGRSVAVPGTSEHQLGLAIDIVDNRNWSLDESQAEMPTQKWLMENSWRYGWILRYPNEKSAITGIIYEPWHYRYVGHEIAAEIYELGICLEEYLIMLTPGVG